MPKYLKSVIFGQKSHIAIDVQIGKDIIKSKQTMEVLGVTFDDKLTWESHIRHTIT